MKITTTVAAVLFASIATIGTTYADEKPAAPKTAETKVDKAVAKPDSNAGMVESKSEKRDPAKDKSKHFHPRDAK